MYCPSCDKTYGAVHSRCPECHSWLKVSAPANHRSKSAKAAAGSAGASASFSTGGQDGGISWEDPTSGGASGWGSAGGAWGDSSPSGSPTDQTPSAGSTWGGGGWGEADKSQSWGEPAPAKETSGWLAGEASESSWGGGVSAAEPNSPRASAMAPAPEDESGWLGSGGGVPVASPHSRSPVPAPSSSGGGGGWLGGAGEEEQEPGWLGSGGGAEPASRRNEGWESASESAPTGGGGWLGDAPDEPAPSMTDMLDEAIDRESGDEYVDDSWVDEEIKDSEFDDLGVPEYVTSGGGGESGGGFMKAFLAILMVLLVGGATLHFSGGTKGEEELAAEQQSRDLETARLIVEAGRENLEKGDAASAAVQFRAALSDLHANGGEVAEMAEVEVLLGRALFRSQDFEAAHEQWKKVAIGPEQYRAEATQGLTEASRQLRIKGNGLVVEGQRAYEAGEANRTLQLGKEALAIFEAHNGGNDQLGKANAVIGRGYYRGRDYGRAEEHLRRAHQLFPAGKYTSDLAMVREATRPVYQAPPPPAPQQSRPRTASAPPRPVQVQSVPQAPNARRPSTRPAPRRSASGGSQQSGQAAPQQPQRMKEIPAYNRQPSQNNRRTRKGSDGVLQTY